VRAIDVGMDLNDRTRVEDVMSTPLETISSKAMVTEAVQAMREHDISALVVTTHPPSIVTSTDVLDAVAAGHDTEELPVSEVMTESVETVPPDLSLEETAAMMTSFGIKHLPVAEDDYVGMVSSTDVTAHLA
jgi:CBS domain-containing protein